MFQSNLAIDKGKKNIYKWSLFDWIHFQKPLFDYTSSVLHKTLSLTATTIWWIRWNVIDICISINIHIHIYQSWYEKEKWNRMEVSIHTHTQTHKCPFFDSYTNIRITNKLLLHATVCACCFNTKEYNQQ